MKRLLLCLFVAGIGLNARAQIMLKDSAVQVVAYWSVGDKYNYEYEEKKYEVQDTDTTSTDKVYERFSLEVVDSTATGYVLEYKTLESKYAYVDKDEQELRDLLGDLGKGMPLRFSTNENGTFQDIVNWEQYQDTLNKGIEIMREPLCRLLLKDKKEVTDSIRASVVQLVDNMFASFKNKNAMLGGLRYLTNLFYFHGTRLELNRNYEGTEQRYSFMSQAKPINVKTLLYVDEVEEEDGYAYLNTYNEYNSDELFAVYIDYVNRIMPSSMLENPIKDDPERPYIFMSEEFNAVVHVNTGWTTSTFYEFTTREGAKQHIKTSKVNILLD